MDYTLFSVATVVARKRLCDDIRALPVSLTVKPECIYRKKF